MRTTSTACSSPRRRPPRRQIGADFRAIGTTTDVDGDNNVQCYNYLDGDLDQVEIFNRVLSPEEVALFYGEGTAPLAKVAQVFVNGPGITGQTSANGVAFRNLAGVDNTFGYPVPGRRQPDQVDPVEQRHQQDRPALHAGRGRPVAAGRPGGPRLHTATYAVSGFTYDAATKTGHVDADHADRQRQGAPVPRRRAGGRTGRRVAERQRRRGLPQSGDGTAGGDFDFRFNVLRGDANQDGAVNALDLGQLKAKLNRTATNPGTGNHRATACSRT